MDNLRRGTYSKEGKGVFASSLSSMAWVPLTYISPEAEAIQQKLFDSMNKETNTESISNGLKKQYDIQLQQIRKKEPSCEIVCAQGPFSGPSQFILHDHARRK